jgi:hypothetical protein
MAEVGLLPYARFTPEVSRAVLPKAKCGGPPNDAQRASVKGSKPEAPRSQPGRDPDAHCQDRE